MSLWAGVTNEFLPHLCIQPFLSPAPMACKNLLLGRLDFCKFFLVHKCLSLNGSLWNKERKNCVKKCRWPIASEEGIELPPKVQPSNTFSHLKKWEAQRWNHFYWETLLRGTGSWCLQRKHVSQLWCLIAQSAPCPEHPLILRFLDGPLFPRSDPGERCGAWLPRLMAQFIRLG